MAKRGRQTKLNDRVREDFCAAIEKGATIEMAAASIGVGYSTIFDWLKRGKTEGGGIYREFSESAREAQCRFGLQLVQRHLVIAVQTNNCNAIQWQLERRFPEVFARPADRPATEATAAEAESLAVQLLQALRSHGDG